MAKYYSLLLLADNNFYLFGLLLISCGLLVKNSDNTTCCIKYYKQSTTEELIIYGLLFTDSINRRHYNYGTCLFTASVHPILVSCQVVLYLINFILYSVLRNYRVCVRLCACACINTHTHTHTPYVYCDAQVSHIKISRHIR